MRKREITTVRGRKRRKSFFLNPTDVHRQPEAAQLSGKTGIRSSKSVKKKKVEKKVFKAPSIFLISQSLKQISSDDSLLLKFEHVKRELLWRVDGECRSERRSLDLCLTAGK